MMIVSNKEVFTMALAYEWIVLKSVAFILSISTIVTSFIINKLIEKTQKERRDSL